MDYGTYKNNLSVVLTQACTDTDTVLHIDNAGAIPVLNEHGLYLTFVDTNEIVEVTSVDTTNNTITVVRGLTSFGGGPASSHNSGTKLSARVIAEHFDNLENNIENNEIFISNHINNTNNPHQVNASQTEVEYLSGSTYKTVLDWLKTTQSAGKISGGEITDNGDGTVSVASGEGFIKTTNNDTAETKFLTWNANSSVSLADNDTNYIYVEYNSGTPQIVSSTSMPSDKNTNILLGIIYREGTDLHITTAGQLISNYANKDFWKDMEVNGKFQRVSGLILSESGTRNIAITAGSIYVGLTKKNYSAFDSSGTDTYTQYYRDGLGGWTKITGATQEDNQYYDDGSGTLANLSNNYYTCRYVYMGVNGDVFVVYGQEQHQKIADAIEEDAPTDIPGILKSVGILIGKIIVREGDTHFEKVYSAFETSIAFGTVADHNELGNLQGGTSGEYYHLSSAEYTRAQNAITKVEDDATPKLGGDLDGNSHNIDLDETTHANQTGIIYKNGIPFIHDFNYGDNGTVTTEGGNVFIGLNAGNFTMGSDATVTYYGSYNVGIGMNSLSSNTTGYRNTGVGMNSLSSNTTGCRNVGVGYRSLFSNTTGYDNVGIGYRSLSSNTTGYRNTGVGPFSGKHIADGSANETSSYSIYVGYNAKALADGDSNEIVIGYNQVGYGSNTVRLGNFGMGRIGTTLTPRNNHDLVIELTNNTTLRFKLKGTDGTVRTATITLS